jgi:hypothetical protein
MTTTTPRGGPIRNKLTAAAAAAACALLTMAGIASAGAASASIVGVSDTGVPLSGQAGDALRACDMIRL